MYQGFPHQKERGTVFSTLSRLFSHILIPCLVFFAVSSFYPLSRLLPDGDSPLPFFSLFSETDPSAAEAAVSASDFLNSYESYQAGDFARSAFQALKEAILQAQFFSDSLHLHYRFADPESYGLSACAISLGQYSMEYFTSQAGEAALFLEQLREIARESLSAEEQLTYDILEWQLIQVSQAGLYAPYTNPLSPGSGVLSELPLLLAAYTFRSESDLEEYLALLEDFPRYFSELLCFTEQKADYGIPLSSYELEESLALCQSFCENYTADPEHHFLVTSFEESLETLDFLTPEQRAAYAARNRSLLAGSVIPAYEETITGLEQLLTEASPTSATASGLCTIPGGEDYYRYLIVSRTGTSRSGEELIELITQRMVSDIRAMDELYQTYPEIGEEINQAAGLTDPQLILMDLQSKMRNDFPVLSGMTCRIRLIPEALENTLQPALYLIPPVDAPDEGSIFLGSASLASPSLYLTLAHEGFPGHLYQTAYFYSTTEDSLRSLLDLPGYTEGWATYVERQAYYYIDDYSEAAAEFLSRNASASMALYALCDLNVHLNGWTASDLSHFLQVWVKGLTEDTIAEIYESILASPGNYLNYHVGAMEFELLLEEARERLGDTFDLKDFHAFLLQTGPCPFDILRQQFEEWIKNAATA